MKNNTPLYNQLIQYTAQNKIPFHMPGHKQGRGIPKDYQENILSIDLTELDETDNLYAPDGPIQRAQQLAAIAFGAQHSFFLVNGSTAGIQTMIACVCNPGDILIVDRNCHSSVISALVLCGVIPKYIYPDYITDIGIVGGIRPDHVEQALIRYPEAKGVLITSPTYHGVCSDLYTIAQIVHKYDKIFLVDEAHGAHFCFHEDLPSSSLEVGADICVQGAHKTLPALTQSAFLHVNSSCIDLQRLNSCLKLFQTSSPSFVLMAYLDIARSIMQEQGKEILGQQIQWIEHLRTSVNKAQKLYCLGKEYIGSCSVSDIDTTRIVVNFSKLGVTGYDAAKKLNTQYNIQVEMADVHNIVSIVSAGNTEEDIRYLLHALDTFQFNEEVHRELFFSLGCYPTPRYAVSPRQAAFAKTELVPFKEAENRISAETITCFPPGIPIICPGEIISCDIIRYILDMERCGGKIVGIYDDFNLRVLTSKI